MEGDELDYELGIPDLGSLHQRKWENSRYRGLDGGLRKPASNSIHQGTIEGMDRDGLLHISCLSACRVEKVEDVLTVGDKVWVKVMNVEEDGKYRLDMRGINQKDGTDTDPNNLDRSNRPKPTRFSGEDPIKLGAILNVMCTRCKGTGHMRHECFNTTGATYEMLEDEPAISNAPASSAAPTTTTPSPFATGANAVQVQKPLPVEFPREAEKKGGSKRKSEATKKNNGRRQKKHRRHSSSSSSGTDTSSSTGSPRKKKRKKRGKKVKESKHRKRRS